MLYRRTIKVDVLINVLKQTVGRLQRYRDRLQGSEALTRYVLIDPILRALGWDTTDPSQVFPEFPAESGGRPDYALLVEGKPHIMVEAKPLNTNLEKARDKGFHYCWRNQVPFYVITNGNEWVVYDVRQMGGKLIAQTSLEGHSIGEVARALLCLWRPAMPSLEVPPPSLIEQEPEPKGRPNSTPKQNTSSLVDMKGDASQDLRPIRIRFPDGVVRNLTSWREVLLCTVDWLKSDIKKKVPIPCGPRTDAPLVATTGEGMRSPKMVGSLFVETHFSAKGIVRSTIWLLEQLEHNPDSVVLEF